MKTTELRGGYAINGDATSPEVIAHATEVTGGPVNLILTDPPYGNIVDEEWDKVKVPDSEFARWMVKWTRDWAETLDDGGAFYVWGGLGKPNFRPFMRYMYEAETPNFTLSNVITWSKKRAYGVQSNYLYTREELAYFVKGNARKPKIFNIPLLETKRGYAGYNAKYPAKSEFYRRTNVWMDITEIFRGKKHPTEKPKRVLEIPIEVHTNPGDWVIDMFAGSGSTGLAARALDRKFLLIEKDEEIYDAMVSRLS
jgi:DNA modification methylase